MRQTSEDNSGFPWQLVAAVGPDMRVAGKDGKQEKEEQEEEEEKKEEEEEG